MGGPLYGCMFMLEDIQPIPHNISAAWICHMQNGGVALWKSTTDVAEGHPPLLASRTRQRESFLHPAALLYSAPGKGREGQKQPQNRGEKKDTDGKFYLSPICLPLHPLLTLSGSHMNYLVLPLNQ